MINPSNSAQQEAARPPEAPADSAEPTAEDQPISASRPSLRFWLPLAVGLIFAAFFSWLTVWPGGSIAKGVSVNGIDLGGMSLPAAMSALDEYAKESLSDGVVLVAPDFQEEVTLSDLGARFAVAETAQDAYSVTRSGGFFYRTGAKLQALFGRQEVLSIGVSVDGRRAAGFLSKLDEKLREEPVAASISLVEGEMVKTPDTPGGGIDSDAAVHRLGSVVPKREPTRVAIPLAPLRAPVTAEDLAAIDTLLASHSTSLGSSSRNRVRNIELASRTIDGLLLRPGEVFSYNEVVGPRLESLGFREAPIYRNGEVVPGTGGGVCQVSTTIYNIALLTDSEIVERSHHSMPVHYVPLGRDATVAYPNIDLRFRNSGSHPMYLEAKVEGWRLKMRAYGSSGDRKDVKIHSTVLRSYPAEVHRKEDPDLPVGETKWIKEPETGYKVVVTKEVRPGTDAVAKETVSQDFYRPVAGIEAVGTKPTGPDLPAAVPPPDGS